MKKMLSLLLVSVLLFALTNNAHSLLGTANSRTFIVRIISSSHSKTITLGAPPRRATR